MTSISFSRHLDNWLTNFNLASDPFAINEADQEQELLTKIFVDRPYLHNVFGDPSHPQTAILMANRGEGKTATREMIAYECLHGKLRRRALPVRYNKFDHLLAQADNNVNQITIRHHVNTIARLILREVSNTVTMQQFTPVSEDEKALWIDCANQFADPITLLKYKRWLDVTPTGIKWDNFTPIETLSTLADLVTNLQIASTDRSHDDPIRYCSIYILIDRVDETELGPEAALAILTPLIAQGPLLNMPKMAFKFFLPVSVARQLKVPADRLCMEQITWSEEALRSIIDQRLVYHSNGHVSHFEDLCSPGVRNIALNRLIDACAGSPRTLIQLCRMVIHSHAITSSPSTFLDRLDLSNTLLEYKRMTELTPVYTSQVATQTSPVNQAPPEEQHQTNYGLFLDKTGHVWIDGKLMTETLSEQEFRLLQILYNRAPHVVKTEELIQAIWHEDYPLGAGQRYTGDQQNLRKLIARLRARLEPDKDGKSAQYIKNAHGRGYWLEKQ